MAQHGNSQALKEAKALVAKGGSFNLNALSRPFAHALQKYTLNVRIESTGKALVGGHENNAHLLGAFILIQERMTIVRHVRASKMRADYSNLVAVRAGSVHPILRLAHFRGRNHLHRFGDLSRVLHALDLAANFLCTGHGIGSSIRR